MAPVQSSYNMLVIVIILPGHCDWLAVTQEREILMSSRQEYQSEQAGRQADGGGQGPEDTRTIQHTDHHLLLLCLGRDHTNRNTKSQSSPPFLHDIIVSVIENGILRGDVGPHVVGKR